MRSFKLFLFALLVGVLGGSVFHVSQPKADTLQWHVKSIYPYRVQIEFYSEDGKLAWPGHGEAFGLNDNRTHRFSLECTTGQNICYGAWVTGNSHKYWGVGLHNHQSCAKCCAVCGKGDTPRVVLEE